MKHVQHAAISNYYDYELYDRYQAHRYPEEKSSSSASTTRRPLPPPYHNSFSRWDICSGSFLNSYLQWKTSSLYATRGPLPLCGRPFPAEASSPRLLPHVQLLVRIQRRRGHGCRPGHQSRIWKPGRSRSRQTERDWTTMEPIVTALSTSRAIATLR